MDKNRTDEVAETRKDQGFENPLLRLPFTSAEKALKEGGEEAFC